MRLCRVCVRMVAAGWLVAGLIAVGGGSARGQGFIVDQRGGTRPLPIGQSAEIRSLGIDAKVQDQVAQVRVTQVFHNPTSAEIEAEYLFPLPDDAAIADLVLMVDGREVTGRTLPKDEARRVFEGIVRSKRDPALLEYMGRGLYRTSVFPIPPGGDRTVSLSYTQLCRRDRDVVEFVHPLATQKHTGRPIERVTLSATIAGRDPIKSVYCPSLDAAISRPDDRRAEVRVERTNFIPATDFRLVYTLAEGAVGASILSYRPSDGEDGYFLLLAAPKIEAIAEQKARPKSVIFVIDRSGSMAGKKIEQARAALTTCLDNLREGDTFNIVAYDDRVETYKPELQRFNAETRADAAKFVANIREGGSTNIDGGLKAALAMLPEGGDRPSYVLFLTDGLPTAGEKRELAIAENCRVGNKAHARVFAFGVGFDVNARLLDRLSGGNGGTTEYVRPDEDLEKPVGSFIAKIARPALTRVAVEVAGTDINRTYPKSIPDLFDGGQLVWVGRYSRSGSATVKLTGQVNGERRTFEFPADLLDSSQSARSGRDYVEKLWAVRRVGAIIDQLDLDGSNKELTDELIALGTRYGILTPYTSFLADERVNFRLSDRDTNRKLAVESLAAMANVDGAAGVDQRGFKQGLQQADRFAAAQQHFEAAQRSGQAGQGQGGGMMGGMGGMGGMGMGGRPLASAPAGPAPAGQGQGQGAGQQPGQPGGGFAGGGGGIGGAGNFGGQPTPGATAFKDHGKAGVPTKPGSVMYLGAPASAGPASPAANVRHVGTKTFFRKDGRWVDSEVKAESLASAIVLEQFTEPYFALARKLSPEQNQYLSLDEPCTVLIDGKVYQVNLPKAP